MKIIAFSKKGSFFENFRLFCRRNKYTVFLLIGSILAVLSLLYHSGLNTLFVGKAAGSQFLGFPVHFIEFNVIKGFIFEPFQFLLNCFFWFFLFCSASIILSISNFKKVAILVLAMSLGYFFMKIDTGTNFCYQGFPLAFQTKCLNNLWFSVAMPITSSDQSLIYKGIDYIFWSILALELISIFVLVERSIIGKFKYIILPLVVTVLGFFSNNVCESGSWISFCLSEGRGFPLAYYLESFNLKAFIYDFIIIGLLYLVVNLIIFYVDYFLKNFRKITERVIRVFFAGE